MNVYEKYVQLIKSQLYKTEYSYSVEDTINKTVISSKEKHKRLYVNIINMNDNKFKIFVSHNIDRHIQIHMNIYFSRLIKECHTYEDIIIDSANFIIKNNNKEYKRKLTWYLLSQNKEILYDKCDLFLYKVLMYSIVEFVCDKETAYAIIEDDEKYAIQTDTSLEDLSKYNNKVSIFSQCHERNTLINEKWHSNIINQFQLLYNNCKDKEKMKYIQKYFNTHLNDITPNINICMHVYESIVMNIHNINEISTTMLKRYIKNCINENRFDDIPIEFWTQENFHFFRI